MTIIHFFPGHFLILLLLTFLSPRLWSQDFEPDYRAAVTGSTVDMATSYVIPVVFHVYQDAVPSTVTDQDIVDAVAHLNSLYGIAYGSPASNISFRLAGRDPYGGCTNGIHRVQVSNPDFVSGTNWHLTHNWDRRRYLNVHVFRSSNSTLAGHAFTLPVYQTMLDGDVKVAASYFDPQSELLAHEVGHYLRLAHPSFCDDASGCLASGDMVCDTEPYDDDHVDFNFFLCEIYPRPGVSSCNNQVLPLDNIMIGWINDCSTKFTLGQIKRMRFAIQWAAPLLVSADNKRCTGIEGVFGYSNNLQNEFEVTSATTFSQTGQPYIFNGSIRVRSGASLTIAAGTELWMCRGSKIIVEPNARLYLYGKVTRSCSSYWEGIEVYGTHKNDNQNHNSNPLTPPLGYKQGMIQCYPGSVIEYANTGIRLYGPDNKTGGIAYCDGLTVRNCKTGVDIDEFGLTNLLPYRASFRMCDFVTDDDFPFPSEDFAGIRMYRVKGVSIASCEFINTKDHNPSPTVLTDFGYGILATDAGFELSRSCDPAMPNTCSQQRRNRFSGLAYGVYIGGILNTQVGSVRSADFVDCYYGIHARRASEQQILFNRFYLGNLPHPSLQDYQAGVVLEALSSNIIMEENSFIGSNGNKYDRIGMVSTGVGLFPHTFRRNSFRDLLVGNLANGICGNDQRLGVRYNCTSNAGNYAHDFSVPTSADKLCKRQSYEVYESQGYSNYPTLNTFTHAGLLNSDFENFATQDISYYHKAVPAQTPYTYNNLNLTPLPENPDACAVRYCEGGSCLSPSVGGEGLSYHDGAATASLKSGFHSLRVTYEAGRTSMTADEQSAYIRDLVERAGRVIHYMRYDTVHVTADSVAAWTAVMERYLAAGGSLLTRHTGGDYHDYPEQVAGKAYYSIDDIRDARRYARAQSSLLEAEADAGDDRAVLARNMLTAIGYHYPPVFGTGSEKAHPPAETAKAAAKFELYPSPGSGMIHIVLTGRATQPAGLRYLVYDRLGRRTSQGAVRSGDRDMTIDLTALPPGIYYVELWSGAGSLGAARAVIAR